VKYNLYLVSFEYDNFELTYKFHVYNHKITYFNASKNLTLYENACIRLILFHSSHSYIFHQTENIGSKSIYMLISVFFCVCAQLTMTCFNLSFASSAFLHSILERSKLSTFRVPILSLDSLFANHSQLRNQSVPKLTKK